MKVRKEYLMTAEEGLAWNGFKATLGPLYPGYESFDRYMNWLKERFAEFGCVDCMEHHWKHESYRVNDWPVWDTGAMSLTVDGRKLDVGTFLMFSASTGEEGLTAPLVYYDTTQGEPEKDAFAGKIVVMEDLPWPDKPFDDRFLESYVITDTNYRSDPEPPAPMLEIVDPTVSNSWATRWSFFNWMLKLVPWAMWGGAAGLLIASRLTLGALRGLYDRQNTRPVPSLVVDRLTSPVLVEAAKAGRNATMKLVSEFFPADAWNFVCFLPGAYYGTDRDEYITINVHTDAMSLTQDNGSLGALGIARYFSCLPRHERRKTLLFCVDSRHFIEGFEEENQEHDPYQVFTLLRRKAVASIGLEHMGEMEGAEDYGRNTMVPTGLPEYTFLKADDNAWCATVLIEAARDSGLERADVKIDGCPGLHGLYKGLVRAVQASVHDLGVCVMGQAGNWCGAHTQTFSTMQYFGAKKFRDEVHLWTQVVGDLMETDALVYDVMWSELNASVRALGRQGFLSEALVDVFVGRFTDALAMTQDGEYREAIELLERVKMQDLFDILLEEEISTVRPALDRVIAKLKTRAEGR